MTTILTRLYSDRAAAEAARAGLLSIGQDAATLHIITAQTEGGAAAAMKSVRVVAALAQVYAQAMTGTQALLVVQAAFAPIGTARNAMRLLRKFPALDVGLEDEDIYLREHPTPDYSNQIMDKHPLLLSNPFRPLPHGHILGNAPILPHKPRTSAMRGGAYMSKLVWPMKLLSAPKERGSAIRGGRLISAMFGLPLLVKSWPSRDDLPTLLR